MDLQHLSKDYGIAITGGIACGKSTIAKIVRDAGHLVIDADQVARDVVAPKSEGLDLIRNQFGEQFVVDGQLNRMKLRELIISDKDAKKRLESITHPLIHKRSFEVLKKEGFEQSPRIWFYEAALIFEAGRGDQFNRIWVAHCPEDIQISRLCKRDKVSIELARKTIAAQMPVADKVAKADLAIDTNCTLEELSFRIKASLQKLEMEFSDEKR